MGKGVKERFSALACNAELVTVSSYIFPLKQNASVKILHADSWFTRQQLSISVNIHPLPGFPRESVCAYTHAWRSLFYCPVRYPPPPDRVSHWTWDAQQILRLDWQVVMAVPCFLCGHWGSEPRTSCLSSACCYAPNSLPSPFLPYFWWWWVFHFIDARNRNKSHRGHDSVAVAL